MENMLTPEEVAASLKVSRQTVYTWLRQGKLNGLKVGELWRVRQSDLEAFLGKKAS